MTNPVLNCERFEQAVHNFVGAVDRLTFAIDRAEQVMYQFNQSVERLECLDAINFDSLREEAESFEDQSSDTTSTPSSKG